MRKIMIILGVLFTITILLSGSAVAPPTWHFARHWEYYEYCINPGDAVGPPDGDYAILGYYPDEGFIVLDLDSGNEMQPGQVFWVFASSGISEYYSVWVGETDAAFKYVGENEDTTNHYFTAPTDFGKTWRYFLIMWESGSTGPGDLLWGPDIDAVGWFGP